jgi:hypothetical protein
MDEENPLSRLIEDDLLDTLYKTLANQQRRKILRYLADCWKRVSTVGPATEIATIESGTESSTLRPNSNQISMHL